MPSIPTWVTTGLLIFAALYTIVQAVRLYLPVYFWTFDRNATRGRAILAVCAKDTSPNEIARAVPAQACLARLLKAQDLNPDEEVCKADFRRRVLYCFVAFGLTLIAQFKPDSPAVLMPLSQALLLCAIGMIIGAVARWKHRVNYFTLMGLIAGSNTDPPALAYANQTSGNDAPAVGYSTVYPLAMFLRILTAQLLILLLAA